MDCRLAATGYFGKGIYSSPSVAKANTYFKNNATTEQVDNPLRYMLALHVCMGKTYKYKQFETANTLTREPDGYDSVTGYVSGGTEFVVYNNDQVYISHVIFYRIPAPVATTNPAPTTTNLIPVATINPAPVPTNPVLTTTNPAPVPTNPAPVPTNPAPVPTNPAPVPTNPAPAITNGRRPVLLRKAKNKKHYSTKPGN